MAGGNIFGRAMSYVLNELVVDKLANRYIFVSFIELVVYFIYIYIYIYISLCVCVCVCESKLLSLATGSKLLPIGLFP